MSVGTCWLFLDLHADGAAACLLAVLLTCVQQLVCTTLHAALRFTCGKQQLQTLTSSLDCGEHHRPAAGGARLF
jgi:hypothetical protein